MEIFDDIFAGWSFKLNNKVNENSFIELISILDEADFLKIKTISLDDREELFCSVSQTAKLFVECYKERKNLSLGGKTMLQIGIDVKMVEGVVRLLYEPTLSLISLDTFTDAWMPVGFFDGALQINSGIINTKKLQEVLKRVTQLSFIVKVEPGENEYFHDYMIHQIGAALYYKGSIENIDGLSEEDYNKVSPFFLSN